jgi:peptidoglycan/xylan/chitin deacetylase (PgdA/CDA1 family)
MRKPLIILFSCGCLLLALAAVFALPWKGISLLSEWREMRGGRIVYSFPNHGRIVALTFDDGPDPRYTPRVLDILKKHSIHATFFLCGNKVMAYPELARRIVAEGHAIGNHTETHPHLENEDLSDVRREIDNGEAHILAVTGQKPMYFRPPRGLLNRPIMATVVNRGYRVVEWSLAFDRSKEKNSRVLRDRVLRLVKPGDILLMHDGSTMTWDERAPTVRELEGIVSGLQARGYRFVTVPEMLPSARPAHTTTVARAKL